METITARCFLCPQTFYLTPGQPLLHHLIAEHGARDWAEARQQQLMADFDEGVKCCYCGISSLAGRAFAEHLFSSHEDWLPQVDISHAARLARAHYSEKLQELLRPAYQPVMVPFLPEEPITKQLMTELSFPWSQPMPNTKKTLRALKAGTETNATIWPYLRTLNWIRTSLPEGYAAHLQPEIPRRETIRQWTFLCPDGSLIVGLDNLMAQMDRRDYTEMEKNDVIQGYTWAD